MFSGTCIASRNIDNATGQTCQEDFANQFFKCLSLHINTFIKFQCTLKYLFRQQISSPVLKSYAVSVILLNANKILPNHAIMSLRKPHLTVKQTSNRSNLEAPIILKVYLHKRFLSQTFRFGAISTVCYYDCTEILFTV